jgi:hypothetical protein
MLQKSGQQPPQGDGQKSATPLQESITWKIPNVAPEPMAMQRHNSAPNREQGQTA